MATIPTAEPTCAVVRIGETFDGKQGLSYFSGISAETVGASGICMHLVTFPPAAAPRPTSTRRTRRRSTSSAANR